MPSYPAVRARPEEDCSLRTPFQRDRDRIVHSKTFRRLKHKTQVFVAPEGDHYRTRLTHTLEACGIARTVARALRLNEDLTEAIGLGHDLGHPPFGHIGEEALDEALKSLGGDGFRHNEHSLRVVDALERDGEGLNLTEQVRDGILNHTGPGKPASLEGRIVRLVDRVAYINHDIDDALRAGILRVEDLPAEEIALLGPTGSERIDTLVADIVKRSDGTGDIVQSREVGGAMLRLRKFMFDRVYLGPEARKEHERVQLTMRGLFDHYLAHPELLPEGEGEISQRVADYLAGMTDRYCIARFTELAVPEESRF
jgi:dGTPase